MGSVEGLAIAVLAVLSAAASLAPSFGGAAAEAATPAKAVPTMGRAGMALTWTNLDDDAHDLVADHKEAAPDSGDRFGFALAGTCGYHCSGHPGMVDKIVVR
ncbi:MAG TPA: hypothetical protein VHZ26_08470 [Caulobacteraceae bacterium]|jgi:plastocyanin|nr:hypothetical protein [Caulobacteraceae bacterium]